MLSLYGYPVKAGISYVQDDVENMTYEGKEKSKPQLYVAAVPERAKL
jgi:hypothetical protein